MNIKPIEFPVKGRCKDITRSSYPRRCGIQGHSRDPLVDEGDELVGDSFTVTFPVLAILDSASVYCYEVSGFGLLRERRDNAPFEVASAAVNEDDDEEDRIEVRDRSSRADAETPGEGHGPISNVVL